MIKNKRKDGLKMTKKQENVKYRMTKISELNFLMTKPVASFQISLTLNIWDKRQTLSIKLMSLPKCFFNDYLKFFGLYKQKGTMRDFFWGFYFLYNYFISISVTL